MTEWWVAPLVTVIVAVVGASGVWLTVLITKRSSERARVDARITALENRLDKQEKRFLKLVNYAQRLRDHIYQAKPPPPEEWPDDLFD